MKTRNGLFADVPENLWNDWHWQAANRAETVEDLKKYMNLTPDEEEGVRKTLGKLRMAVTPYYLSLIDLNDPFDPIRKMAIPRAEELEYADLLLHVIDVSNPQWQQQAAIVESLIRELKADHIPCLRVYNKCDLAFSGQRSAGEDTVSISAKTGEGVPELLACIDKKLDKGTRRVTLHLPYDKAGLLDGLYREAKVESVEYAASIDVVAVCPPKVLGQVKDYVEGWHEEKEDWEL